MWISPGTPSGEGASAPSSRNISVSAITRPIGTSRTPSNGTAVRSPTVEMMVDSVRP